MTIILKGYSKIDGSTAEVDADSLGSGTTEPVYGIINDVGQNSIEDIEVLWPESLTTPSSEYVEAEAVATNDAINSILTALTVSAEAVSGTLSSIRDTTDVLNMILEVLRDAGLIATE